MTTDIVGAIEQLQQQRQAALAELARIDNELERAKLAIQDMLGGRPLRESVKVRREYLREDGSLSNQVMAALAASEPRTLHDLAAYIGPDVQVFTLGNQCRRMVLAGRLFMARLNKTGRPAIYARTREGLSLNGHAPAAAPPAAPEGDAADAG